MKPVNRIRAQLISIVFIYVYSQAQRWDWKLLGRCPVRVYYYILIASIVLVSRDCGVIHTYCSSESSSGREGWNEGCSHYIRLVIVENVYNNLPASGAYIVHTYYNDIICRHISYIYTHNMHFKVVYTMHARWRDDYTYTNVCIGTHTYIYICTVPIYIYMLWDYNALMATKRCSGGGWVRGSWRPKGALILCRYERKILYISRSQKGLEHNTHHAQVH